MWRTGRESPFPRLLRALEVRNTSVHSAVARMSIPTQCTDLMRWECLFPPTSQRVEMMVSSVMISR